MKLENDDYKRPQTVGVWPASPKMQTYLEETPYKLLDNKAGWLARMAWALLHRLEALQPHFQTVETWTFNPVNAPELMDVIAKALDNHFRFGRGDRDDVVLLIGSHDFQKLAHSPAFVRNMTFTAGPFRAEDPYHLRRVFGVPIHVVPTLTGMALVPRVLVEKPASR